MDNAELDFHDSNVKLHAMKIKIIQDYLRALFVLFLFDHTRLKSMN